MSQAGRHLKQCKACGEYIDSRSIQCQHCGSVNQKERQQGLDEEQKEELHKRKLEAMHVPAWLRSVVNAVNFCQAEPRIHQLVRLLGGATGMAITYSALYWTNYAAGNFFPMHAAWVLLPLGLPCLAAFWLGHHFFFSAFYIILEAVGSVFETEKDDHIRRGVHQEKARAKGALKQAQAAARHAQPRPELKLPGGIQAFDAEKDEDKRVMDAITRALEQDL